MVFLKLWRFFSAAALLFAFLRVGVWLFSISFAEDSNFSSGTMFVSALLTSVGINSAICFSFLVLYSILRKQPAYYGIYIPRLVAEGKIKQRSDFNLERLIPSANWVKKAWMLSEEELLSSSGLDAVVFMRIVTFSLKVLLFAGVIGIFVLLPVNCSGDQLADVDIVNISNNSLDVFTISNVKDGSHCWQVMVPLFSCVSYHCIYLLSTVL